jgi:hypothetical protein
MFFADIYEIDRAILLAFLQNPALALRAPLRKPRYSDNMLTSQEAFDALLFLSRQARPETYSRVDAQTPNQEHIVAIGTCGSVLYLSTSRGQVCIDVDDQIVPGSSHFSALEQ